MVVGGSELVAGGGDGLTMVRVVVVIELFETVDGVEDKVTTPEVRICRGAEMVDVVVTGEVIAELGEGGVLDETWVVGIETERDDATEVEGEE